MIDREFDTYPTHLRGVRVALDGSLIAPGSMTYPVDDNGHFPCPEASLLRIARDQHMRIVRCHASRHDSGFLLAEEFGSELFIPPTLANLVLRALRFGSPELLQASLTHTVNGALRDSTSRIKTLDQPLSAWSLSIEEDEHAAIRVDLSARLYAYPSTIPEWSTTTGNFWPDNLTEKLKVAFRVDALTRVACFGAHIPLLPAKPETPAPVREDASFLQLDIARAPVGRLAQFAIDGAHWYHLYESDIATRKRLSLTEHRAPTCDPFGMLNDSYGYVWPRISLRGLDMEIIASMLADSAELRASIKSDTIGQAEHGRGRSRFEDLPVANLKLDFWIDGAGLHIALDGDTTAGRVSRNVLLVWELLILRFPYFTRFMSSSTS